MSPSAELVPVGFALRSFTLRSGVSRCVLELARRLPARGFLPRVAARRLPGGDARAALDVPFPVRSVPMWPFPSVARAASFDWFARRRLAAMGVRLVHGQGDLSRQDLLTVNNCDAAAARHVPDGRRPSPGVDYVRRRQFGPGGCRLVAANSAMVARDVVELYGVPPEKVRTVYFGVDLERFHPRGRAEARAGLRRHAGWPPDARVVLAVLSGDPVKRNLGLLTRAMELLAGKRPAGLCVVGQADLSGDPAARRLEAAGRLWAAGPTPTVEAFFAGADVLALPAHYEEFGLPVLEALASGCPVVVGARVGAREVLRGAGDGFVVEDVRDPGALAAALETALERGDPAECRKTADAYSWDRHADAVAALYRELLAGRTA